MAVSGTDRQDRRFIGELVAAWIVVLFVLVIGFAVISFHVPGVRDRDVPRWYDPPLAGVEPREDEPMGASKTEAVRRPTDENICNMILRSASYARTPPSGASAHQSGLPC